MAVMDFTPRWLSHFTKLVAVSTLFLVFAGAMVTSTGSGLAVPDWPLSYGMWLPPMVGGIFYEHGHRMIAAAVGLFTVIQACMLQRFEPKLFLRRLGWISVVVVIFQGLLGGLTVIFLLPPAISIGHAALAEVFLCLNVAIAFFATQGFPRLTERKSSAPVRVMSRVLPLVVFGQVLLGALMRHLGAGLAIPDFPMSFGGLVPEFSSLAIAVNFSHRAGALMVVLLALAIAPRMFRSRVLVIQRLHVAILAILVVQIGLGAFTVWSAKQTVVTSLHVMTGALLLACSAILALAAGAVSEPAPLPEGIVAVGGEIPA